MHFLCSQQRVLGREHGPSGESPEQQNKVSSCYLPSPPRTLALFLHFLTPRSCKP